jgi:phospholipid/cholesterol/gamma-HCH transport system permease protein
MARLYDVERLGAQALNTLFNTREVFRLIIAVVKNSFALFNVSVRKVFFKQIYFTGIQALPVISIIGTLIGVMIITQVTSIAGVNPELIGKILVWTVVRELGPLLAAIIITARSSTAVASELGAMKANKEIDSLKIMGIDPLEYLIVPRVIGTALCVVVLTFYFQVMAIGGGLLIYSALSNVPFLSQLEGMFSALGIFDVLISVFKSLVFGAVIATSSCFNGLKVKYSITEIPQVTSAAVMQSLLLVFVLDGIITLVSYV